MILRKSEDIEMYFNQDGIMYVDIPFRVPFLKQIKKEFEPDNNIGVWDLETCPIDEFGNQQVYASDFSASKVLKKYYLNDDNCGTPNDIITSMFNDMVKDYKGYT